MIVYSVYDTVAEEFGPLGIAATPGVAKRQFEQLMNSIIENPAIRKDYELWQVGTFDYSSGEIKPDKRFIVSGLDYCSVD